MSLPLGVWHGGVVDPGPTGEFAVDTDSGAGGIFEDIVNVNNGDTIQQMTIYCWVFPISVTSTQFIMQMNEEANDQNSTFTLQINTALGDGRLSFTGDGSATINDNVLQGFTTAQVFTVNAWNSILFSFDLTESDFASGVSVYVNDAAPSFTATNFESGKSLALDTADLNIGIGRFTQSANPITGYLGPFWVDFDRFVDFSVESNRRKFIDSSKRPVALGTTGATPFGSAPTLYFDNPASTYNVNRGSSTDFRFHDGGTDDQNGFDNAPSSPDTGTLA